MFSKTKNTHIHTGVEALPGHTQAPDQPPVGVCVRFDQQHNDNLLGSQRHSSVTNQPVPLTNICADVLNSSSSNTLLSI